MKDVANNLVYNALKSKKTYTEQYFLFDKKTGDRTDSWKFTNPDFSVLYNRKKVFFNNEIYDMDEKTVSLVNKKLKKEEIIKNVKDFSIEALEKIGLTVSYSFVGGLAILVLSCTVGAGVYGLDELVNRKEKKVEKQVKIYEKTLPNWNDTIRLAETDEAVIRAINKREQSKLKVEHYRDSLMNQYSK